MLHKNCKICGKRYWGDHTPESWTVSAPLCRRHVVRVRYFLPKPYWQYKIVPELDIATAVAKAAKIHADRARSKKPLQVCENLSCYGAFYAKTLFRGMRLCGNCAIEFERLMTHRIRGFFSYAEMLAKCRGDMPLCRIALCFMLPYVALRSDVYYKWRGFLCWIYSDLGARFYDLACLLEERHDHILRKL